MAKTRALRPQPTRPSAPRSGEAMPHAALETPVDLLTPVIPAASIPSQPPVDSGASEQKSSHNANKAKTQAVEAPETATTTRPSDAPSRNIQIQIPSSAEYVRVVRLAVLGVASRMPFSYDDVEDIKLAVSEACNNAILHAATEAAATQAAASSASVARNEAAAQTKYELSQDEAIEIEAVGHVTSRVDATVVLVTMTPWPDRLEITIADEGFVPPPGLSARVPAAPREKRDALSESGLGLFLMQSLMDQVEHGTGADSNTVVRLVKYLPRASSQA